MTRLLDPMLDIVFKKIFGNPETPEVTIDFLNAVLQDEDPIKSIKFAETELTPDYFSDKYPRLDIRATTNNKQEINIEVQVNDTDNMLKRSMFYGCKLFTDQLKKGQPYETINRTICINITDYTIFPNEKDYHNCFKMMNTKTNNLMFDEFEIHYIEIPKYIISQQSSNSPLDIWTEFIKDPYSKNMSSYKQKVKSLNTAEETLIKVSSDKTERYLAEKREEGIRERLSSLAFAENKGIAKERQALKYRADKLLQEGKINKEIYNTMLGNMEGE